MTEDNYLNAMIINNNYDKTIKLLRTTYHYFEPIYSKSFLETAGSCQNILLNVSINSEIRPNMEIDD